MKAEAPRSPNCSAASITRIQESVAGSLIQESKETGIHSPFARPPPGR
jgi:hypothetical protein